MEGFESRGMNKLLWIEHPHALRSEDYILFNDVPVGLEPE